MIQPTNFLTKLPALSNEENSILQKKYSSPRIGSISENEILYMVSKLLLKIKVITGWVLPSGELMSALLDVFVKKITEDYPALNINEIEFAFIKYGTVVEDWGKEVNLNLIDKVLIPYVEKRFEVSKNEETKKEIPVQKIYTDEEILNQRRGEIEQAFQSLKNDGMPIIHSYFKEVLKQDGIINGETLEDFFKQAVATKENLYVK